MARTGTSGTARPQDETTPAASRVMAASKAAPEARPDRGNGSPGEQTSQFAGSTFSSDEIAQRAYQIYEREGRMDGRDMDHWLQAERELREERDRTTARPAAQQARGPSGQNRPAEQNQSRGGGAKPPQRPEEAPRSARRHQASMA